MSRGCVKFVINTRITSIDDHWRVWLIVHCNYSLLGVSNVKKSLYLCYDMIIVLRNHTHTCMYTLTLKVGDQPSGSRTTGKMMEGENYIFMQHSPEPPGARGPTSQLKVRERRGAPGAEALVSAAGAAHLHTGAGPSTTLIS